jgi:uncharacterized protein (DUF1697 family)
VTRHIALLRAINVGKGRQVPMKDLSALFTTLGARDVVTYIQSGNVVFTPPSKRALSTTKLAEAIEARFGFPVPVILTTDTAISDVFAHNPFLARGEDRKLAHVVFLSGTPKPAAAEALDVGTRSPGDEGALRGEVLYLHLANGAGKSRVSADWLDRVLGVTATQRNWNTVEKLVELSRPT